MRFINKAIFFKTPTFLYIFLFFNIFILQNIQAQQSVAIVTGTGVPVSGLNNWYSAAPILGLQYIIHNNENSKTILEFHYQSYSDKSLSDREFYWMVDRTNYKSPEANAYMDCIDFIIKTRMYFPEKNRSFGKRQLNPFTSYGLGLYLSLIHI